jgi:carbon monoxide dehydrogenase subunit G
MELNNEFTVGVPVDEAWKVLTDVERIAPCLPGAELQEVEGDEYRGVVKIKVGPITAQYKGTARFQEKDDANHKAVLRAEGRDTRGQGNASATITATLVPEGADATKVTVATDLTITGKVAQFGRGVLADVSAKLMDQFAVALDAEVRSGSAPSAPAADAPAADLSTAGAPADASPAAAPSGPRKIESKPAEPINVGSMLPGIAKRYASGIGATLVVVLWLMRRRRKKRK